MSWLRLCAVLIAASLALAAGKALLATAVLIFGLVGVGLAARREQRTAGISAVDFDPDENGG